MSVSIRFPRVLFALAALGLPVCAADTTPTPVRTFVQAFVGDAGQSAVSATAVPNLYEVRLGDQFVYVTADGKFFLHGDLYSRGSATARADRAQDCRTRDNTAQAAWHLDEVRRTSTVRERRLA